MLLSPNRTIMRTKNGDKYMRKMASLRTVKAVTPIEGADRIETVTVDGWDCVVKKNEFSVGDTVVYFEIDTFLPLDNPTYAFLAERGKKSMIIKGKEVTGHVLRTAKLRGVYSQGLVMSPAVLDIDVTAHSIGDDVSAECNVCEYEPIGLAPGAIGSYDTSVAPRTDAMRIQNCTDVWDTLKKVKTRASIKVDGMSTTIVNDIRRGRVRVFSHSQELSLDEGFGKIIVDCADGQGILAFINANPGITVQAELVGPKINSNRLKLDEYRLFVFAVWDQQTLGKVAFENKNACIDADGYDSIRNSMCPILDVSFADFDTVHDVVQWAESLRGNVTKDTLDEGCVFHVMDTSMLTDDERFELRNALGGTMEVKVINNKYLLKHHE